MKWVVLAIGFWLVGTGFVGLLVPSKLAALVTAWVGWPAVWLGALLRIAFGVALWSHAPESRIPLVLRILGALSMTSGILLPAVGPSRLAVFVRWWSQQPQGFIRAWSGLAAAVGGLLLWAVLGFTVASKELGVSS